MLLINCEINLIPSWYDQFFTCSNVIEAQVTTLTKTGTNHYVPVVTLSAQDNVKLLEKLKLGFIWSIN